MHQDYNSKDVEFLQMMIPHHEAAITAAAHEVVNGQNQDVKDWALAIFAGQREEIAKFRAWLQDRGLYEKQQRMTGM